MFNDDEVQFAFNRMHEYSPVDGFIDITESLGDMIKYLANEPSVGLFYVQQHTQNAVPNLVNLKNNVTGKSHEMTLHTEDSEDSITMMKSMKECGYLIADEMLKDIKKSLAIISTKQPKKGLISSRSSSFKMGRTSSWGPSTWGRNDGERTTNYFSTVFRSAKQKASSLKWQQVDAREMMPATGEKFVSSPNPLPEISVASTSTTTVERTGDELPVSSQIIDEIEEEELEADESLLTHQLLSSENFDEFRADREEKLEQWLGGWDNQNGRCKERTDLEGLQLDRT